MGCGQLIAFLQDALLLRRFDFENFDNSVVEHGWYDGFGNADIDPNRFQFFKQIFTHHRYKKDGLALVRNATFHSQFLEELYSAVLWCRIVNNEELICAPLLVRRIQSDAHLLLRLDKLVLNTKRAEVFLQLHVRAFRAQEDERPRVAKTIRRHARVFCRFLRGINL